MRKYIVGTSALALSAMLAPTTSSSTALVAPVQIESSNIRMAFTGSNNSSDNESRNFRTRVFNWHQFSKAVFSDSRGFNEEEAVKHLNAIKSISKAKGQRFKLL